MNIIIYTDGASRKNPGISASGYAIYDSQKRELDRRVVSNGINTNNYAEYTAIISALEWCYKNLDNQEIEVKLFSDSQLAVKQINGRYRVKSESMKELYNTVMDLVKHFRNVEFLNRLRNEEGISKVDRDLNKFLDSIESNR